MNIVAARLDTEMIDRFRKITHQTKSEVVRDLVDAGKKHRAVELYKNGKVSLGLGSRLAGVTLSEFFDLLGEHNVDLNLTLEDVQESVKAAKKMFE
ncbi:MAG TPA: UPF0175 family protein [Candidatus Nanoarchaeia archaeon]|nr:UPF0175 family protein [Candidatus Nanoarchaeia archaeon]